MSLLRSSTAMLPSRWCTARSPVPYHPPRKARAVASGSRKYCPASTKRIKDPKSGVAYLLHNLVAACNNFAHRASISGNVD
jgi:hypothetical protein